jgi:DNA-binding response OmpR family regulator
MRVLVAEDEPDLARLVAMGLRREGMAVDVALDGQEALDRLEVVDYDVVVLDRDLPRVHGDAVCRLLVERRAPCRILMLTAADALEDRVAGLNLGADDYLVKPFAFAELAARIRALVRRPARGAPPVLRAGDLILDAAQQTVSRAGRPIALTPKEFALLEALLAAGGAVVSAEELLERVWDEHADPLTNTVRVTMMRLRHKLGPPPLVDTVVGRGYRVLP